MGIPVGGRRHIGNVEGGEVVSYGGGLRGMKWEEKRFIFLAQGKGREERKVDRGREKQGGKKNWRIGRKERERK